MSASPPPPNIFCEVLQFDSLSACIVVAANLPCLRPPQMWPPQNQSTLAWAQLPFTPPLASPAPAYVPVPAAAFASFVWLSRYLP